MVKNVEIVPLSETKPLLELERAFGELVLGVESMLDAELAPEAEDMAMLAQQAERALSGPERIDGIVALINAREFQELLLRKAVQHAEQRARHHAAFVKALKGSIELFMLEKGIAAIEGFAHQLKLYKQSDQLVIESEQLIPDKYWKLETVVERKMNKEELLADLKAGKEVPGASLETGRKRLNVK